MKLYKCTTCNRKETARDLRWSYVYRSYVCWSCSDDFGRMGETMAEFMEADKAPNLWKREPRAGVADKTGIIQK